MNSKNSLPVSKIPTRKQYFLFLNQSHIDLLATTGLLKNTQPKSEANIKYTAAQIQPEDQPGLCIASFIKASPPMTKWEKLAIATGRLYMPPIKFPFAVQFSIAKPK